VDHVAIARTGRTCPAGSMGQDAQTAPSRQGWENHWPPGARPGEIPGDDPARQATLEWTNWPLFTAGLVQRGYGDEDIRKIIGGNMLRVARQVFAARSPA